MSEDADPSHEAPGRAPLVRLSPGRYSRRLREQTGLSPFGIEATQQGRTTRVVTKSVGFGPAPAEVCERLGLRPGSDVVHRMSWSFVDDEPIQLAVTYLPLGVAGESAQVADRNTDENSMYARLEELGWPVARVREEITARMPTVEEAGALGMPSGVPVIELLHTSMDDWKRPFAVVRVLMRADLNSLAYEMPVED
jgi:GntR family transcriptional regulator